MRTGISNVMWFSVMALVGLAAAPFAPALILLFFGGVLGACLSAMGPLGPGPEPCPQPQQPPALHIDHLTVNVSVSAPSQAIGRVSRSVPAVPGRRRIAI